MPVGVGRRGDERAGFDDIAGCVGILKHEHVSTETTERLEERAHQLVDVLSGDALEPADRLEAGELVEVRSHMHPLALHVPEDAKSSEQSACRGDVPLSFTRCTARAVK